MTSNIGASLITTPAKNLGFNQGEYDINSDYNHMKDRVTGELKKTFRPEFINRIDDIIVFNKLNKTEIESIAEKLISGLVKRLDDMEIEANIDESTLDALASKGFDPVYGARPLKRTIVSSIEDMIAEKMLDGTIKQGDKINIAYVDDKFIVEHN